MKKKKNIITFSIIFLVIVLSSIGFYFMKKSTNASQPVKAQMYTIAEGEKVFINGVITPNKREDVYLDASKGNVDKVAVKDGQVVKQGDTLFTYKNDTVSQQIQQLVRQADGSRSQESQYEDKLYKLKKQAKDAAKDPSQAALLPQINTQIGTYEDQIASIQAQIDSLQGQIDDLKPEEHTTVSAPIDGKVTINNGAKSLGTAYMTIQSSAFYVKGSINEKEYPKLKLNQEADILILATNKVIKGKVTLISDKPMTDDTITKAATGGSSNISYYEVDIDLNSQEGLVNGFHVQATVNLTEAAVKIPKKAVLTEKGKSYVFMEIDKKLKKQEITYTESGASDVIINSGLKDGDTIVTNPTTDMKEGTSVE